MIYDVTKLSSDPLFSGVGLNVYRGNDYGRTSGASETEITERQDASPTTVDPEFCAFGSLLTHDGNTFLQGGQISGGSGSFAEDEIDLGATGSLPTSGFCYVKIDYTAIVDSGVLLAGGDVTAVTFTAHDTTVPSNDMPTASDPDGFIYVVLATYTESGVAPTNCGNINVFHCPGSLYATRDTGFF